MFKVSLVASLLCVATLLIYAPFANASPTEIVVGDVYLLPNTPNQTVAFSINGVPGINEAQGLNFNIQVADGGPGAGGSDFGPSITALDIVGPGTIFHPNNTGQVGGPIVSQVAGATTTTNAGTVTANGILGFVTFDTTAFNLSAGPWALIMSNTLNGPTDLAGVPIRITDGRLLLIPEPCGGIPAAAGMLIVLGVLNRRTH